MAPHLEAVQVGQKQEIDMTRPTRCTVLAAAADAMSEGCCQMFQDGECCMSGRAREVFTAINEVGGPSLEECEAIARGEVRLVRQTVTAR